MESNTSDQYISDQNLQEINYDQKSLEDKLNEISGARLLNEDTAVDEKIFPDGVSSNEKPGPDQIESPPSPPPFQSENSSSNSADSKPMQSGNDEEPKSLAKAKSVQVPPTPELTPAMTPKSAPVLHRVVDDRDLRLFRVLKIDDEEFCRALYSPEEISLQYFIESAPEKTTEHRDVLSYQLESDMRVSCVNWKGRHFITGTDIVKVLLHRYETFAGRKPASIKKFEEGIFSDLRRLTPPKDCVLEGTRSDFLLFLFDYDCVRSKKKQKVFFWKSFIRCHQNLFCDAMDRELSRIEMAKAIGLSIEEFIKSGVVPTGSSSQDIHKRPLPFDWTLMAEDRPETGDTEGYKLEPMLAVDQIHYIRNDVSNLFNLHLRSKLFERTDIISHDVHRSSLTMCENRSMAGEKVDISKRSSPILSFEKSSAARSRSRASTPSGGSTDESEFSPGRYVRRRAAQAAEKAVSLSVSPPKSTEISKPSPRRQKRKIIPARTQKMGVPIKLKMRRPLPFSQLEDHIDDYADLSPAFHSSDFGPNSKRIRRHRNLDMAPTPLHEYEAAYILLCINRGLM